MINSSFLDQIQRQRLIIEFECEYSSRWCPSSNHQMMAHSGEGIKIKEGGAGDESCTVQNLSHQIVD